MAWQLYRRHRRDCLAGSHFAASSDADVIFAKSSCFRFFCVDGETDGRASVFACRSRTAARVDGPARPRAKYPGRVRLQCASRARGYEADMLLVACLANGPL